MRERARERGSMLTVTPAAEDKIGTIVSVEIPTKALAHRALPMGVNRRLAAPKRRAATSRRSNLMRQDLVRRLSVLVGEPSHEFAERTLPDMFLQHRVGFRKVSLKAD
jgi:hypothetical protein